MQGVFNFIKFSCKCTNYFLIHRVSSKLIKEYQCKYRCSVICLLGSTIVHEKNIHSSLPFSRRTVDETNKDKPKKEISKSEDRRIKKVNIYITLIENENEVTVTTLEDASKLALRRNLKLVKIKDYESKTERPTYQLMTAADYFREEKRSKNDAKNKTSSIKGVKLLPISSKISQHDLDSKIKNIIKWVDKRFEVRVAISSDNDEAENVYNKIEKEFKDIGRIVQKRQKGSDIRFQILPVKIVKNKSDEKESTTKSSSDSGEGDKV